jgi:hypothetical protein
VVIFLPWAMVDPIPLRIPPPWFWAGAGGGLWRTAKATKSWRSNPSTGPSKYKQFVQRIWDLIERRLRNILPGWGGFLTGAERGAERGADLPKKERKKMKKTELRNCWNYLNPAHIMFFSFLQELSSHRSTNKTRVNTHTRDWKKTEVKGWFREIEIEKG